MTMRQAAGGAGDIDDTEREQATGQREIGSAPIWKDADEPEADRTTTGAEISKAGAIPGAIAGASAVGPTGGIIGAAAGEKSVAGENGDLEADRASDGRGDR